MYFQDADGNVGSSDALPLGAIELSASAYQNKILERELAAKNRIDDVARAHAEATAAAEERAAERAAARRTVLLRLGVTEEEFTAAFG